MIKEKAVLVFCIFMIKPILMRLKKIFIFIFLLIFIIIKIDAQNGFHFYGNNSNHQRVKFKLINNLIIIPLEINGKQLSFILDTGVNKTILFNLATNDDVTLHNVKKVSLQGLGSGDAVAALISKGNQFKIDNLISTNEKLYVILESEFDISSKMGTTIHGIIGYNLLRNVIARVNYNKKCIDFYNPKTFKYPSCKKCQTFPLEFYRNKPYITIDAKIDTVGNKKIKAKMLIDSGGTDALWLFEGTKKEIKTPNKHFDDILGEGLSGTIYGKRSKVPEISLGRFKILNPTVSFLDSLSTHNARKFSGRNGSIGGGVLKRFKVWLDYPNKKVTFKKNGSLKKPFYYNMSGLSIAYAGKELVREEGQTKAANRASFNQSKKNTISFITSYSYRFKSIFKIDKVVKGSPADLAGLLTGDLITKINGKSSYDYKLSEILSLFQERPNKKIKLTVKRLGQVFKCQFYLRKRI